MATPMPYSRVVGFIMRGVKLTATTILLVGCDCRNLWDTTIDALKSKHIVIATTSLNANMIAITSGQSNIKWHCGISEKDKTLCRGRADHMPTQLLFFGNTPVDIINSGLMLYKSHGVIVGVSLQVRDSRENLAKHFAPLIDNRYEFISAPKDRLCGQQNAVNAIAAADHNDTANSTICADLAPVLITWRFYTGGRDDKLLMHLVMRAPGLEGPNSWWF